MAAANSGWRFSGDFRKPDGSPTYPDFDLTPLKNAPGVEMALLGACQPESRRSSLRISTPSSSSPIASPRKACRRADGSRRVARFGVGYDTVDVDACTNAGIAIVITPDGVRRPVAVSILTLMLALAGKLMIKDKLTREAAGICQAPPTIWGLAS